MCMGITTNLRAVLNMLKSVWMKSTVVGLETAEAASLAQSIQTGVFGAAGAHAVRVMGHH